MFARRKLDLPDGLRLGAQTSGGHVPVLREDGTALRSPSGLPIKVSLTPSDWRSEKNELARIRRALDGRTT